MKKIYALILVTVLLISTAIPANAALPEQPAVPYYNHIDSYSVNLTINQNSGVASCTATCYTAGSNTIEIEYNLQRYLGSYWGTVKTWTSSGTSYASINQSWAVYSGYTYRGKATYRVYNSAGTLLETGSATKTYSYPSN
jgi:hypothetical protein